MLYCRPISEFSLFEEFKPGEFKIIDFLRENLKQSKKIDSDFLEGLRILNCYGNEINEHGLIYDSYDDEFDSEKRKQFLAIMKQYGAQELTIINQILKERHFIRTDNYIQSFLIANIVNSNDYGTEFKYNDPDDLLYHYQTPDWVGDIYDIHMRKNTYYEALKPTTNKELGRIFDVLRDKLSPIQFEIVRFYILNVEIYNHYAYTREEARTIRTALRNIRNPHLGIASTINEIMDNTLF
ncbi:hypothetical protein IKF12_00690 [Candidatus Saccharibacteria bacterium]|nr:hypothetical protein [Candidatus Saccharibacteria bacterium]